MKIKELHLRNIASIEKADIDFENGLNDPTDGQPASIFLISGDTGSGKSVLLDGISMALFKTTPRIENVSAKRNNEFRNNNGEAISIFSLEQYTRLGISDKDECYSELLFEGNDGRDYTARLTLGMSRKRQKDSDGQTVIEHKNPVWTLRCGKTEWNKDRDIVEQIKSAIGLTFEQFNRMAMLAQGQFANFLCGGRDERSAILEQLTNTQQFTRYGNAIRNLFTDAKEKHTTAKKILDELNKSIGNIDESELILQIENGTKELETIKDDLDKVNSTLQIRLQLDRLQTDKNNATVQLEKLKDTLNSDKYQQQENLVKLWDTTESIRREYHNLVSERKKKEAQKRSWEQGKDQFQSLGNDLTGRIGQNQKTEEGLKKVHAWLQEKKHLDDLFTKADTVATKLDLLIRTQNELAQVTAATQAANSQLPNLQTLLQSTIADETAADDAVKTKDSEITAQQTERENLHPTLLTEKTKKVNEKKQKLQDLQHLTETSQKYRTDLAKVSNEIVSDEEILKQLTKVKTLEHNNFEEAKAKEKEAANRYSVMSSSVDDTLTELRQQLRNADHCPLCGQSLENHTFESVDFQKMLTPLEIERKQTEKNRQEAEARYNEALKKVSGQDAKLTEQRKRQKELQDLYNNTEHDIRNALPALSLTFNEHLSEQIQERLKELQTCQNELQAEQKQAEDLLLRINKLQKEKEALLQVKNVKTQKVNGTRLDISNLQIKVQEYTKQQTNLLEAQNASIGELNSDLATFFPDWKTDLSLTKSKLQKEANEYIYRKNRYEEECRKLENSVNLCKEMEEICLKVKKMFPDWTGTPTPAPSETTETVFRSKWTTLLSQASILAAAIKDTEDSIRHSETAINDFHTQNRIGEAELERLIEQENNIETARQYLNDISTRIATQKHTIDNADLNITELLSSQSKTEEEIPDTETMQATKNKLETIKDEALTIVNTATERMNALKGQKNRRTQLEAELATAAERFNRWAILDRYFGGDRFRNLVQTHILKPLLNNANNYLSKISDRYILTCSEHNEQLAILVLDRYNKNEMRSATVLSGGERFMISLALSLALSSLNRPDLNINTLFIDEGFGTLDEKNLDSVMQALETLQEIAGQRNRRVGVISHREELYERIPTQIRVRKKGEGRSIVEVNGKP